MSSSVTLTLRASAERIIEAECITPDRFATLTEYEIATLPVWDGRQQLQLGDVFDVKGANATTIQIIGNLSKIDAIGAGMTMGELVIEGKGGRYIGTRMAGGVLRVLGDAGDGAGLEMTGGVLDITGNAGDRVGASRMGASKGMLGGEIIVRGMAGAGVGTRMRRGTIVCGSVGPHAGEAMIAGNIIVLGSVGDNVGRYNKRGSIVALGPVSIPLTYRYASTYRPPHLSLTFRYLRSRFNLPIQEPYTAGLYRRYSGDLTELGRGEILEWIEGEGK